MSNRIIVIGSGAAGLSAALELAKNNIKSLLVSDMPSERAQSVMAEGGINASFNRNGDSPKLHAEETWKAGRSIADLSAVQGMTKASEKMIRDLFDRGMNFTLNEEGEPDARPFGGQSVARTYYAAAGTGKQLMHTLIDQTRRYEASGIVQRMTGWGFCRLLYRDNEALGCVLVHVHTGEEKKLQGRMIIASGGLGGMFGNATGSVANRGTVSANLFASGVRFSNGEFIQYHPTTAHLPGKNMLISEAVRGEGGRLFVLRDGKPYYFMEDRYPERGNLMPRDVIAREEHQLQEEGYSIYLDMRHLDSQVREVKLQGVSEDCRRFLGIDPGEEPIPVEPGIHYFMGGIWVDRNHRTSMKNLYAAGECAAQYHGANRLGGNSLLDTLYGGGMAARSAIEDEKRMTAESVAPADGEAVSQNPIPDQGISIAANTENAASTADITNMTNTEIHVASRKDCPGSYVDGWLRLNQILQRGLCILRNEEILKNAEAELERLMDQLSQERDSTATPTENQSLRECCLLGKAMLRSAEARKESRGAHLRSDYPEERKEFEKISLAEYREGSIQVRFVKAGEAIGN